MKHCTAIQSVYRLLTLIIVEQYAEISALKLVQKGIDYEKYLPYALSKIVGKAYDDNTIISQLFYFIQQGIAHEIDNNKVALDSTIGDISHLLADNAWHHKNFERLKNDMSYDATSEKWNARELVILGDLCFQN